VAIAGARGSPAAASFSSRQRRRCRDVAEWVCEGSSARCRRASSSSHGWAAAGVGASGVGRSRRGSGRRAPGSRGSGRCPPGSRCSGSAAGACVEHRGARARWRLAYAVAPEGWSPAQVAAMSMGWRGRRSAVPAPSSWGWPCLVFHRRDRRGFSLGRRSRGRRGSRGGPRWQVGGLAGTGRRVDTSPEGARRRANRSSRRRPSTSRSRSIRNPSRRRSTGSASSMPRSNRSAGCSTRPIRRKSRSNRPSILGRCSTSGPTIERARRSRPDRDRCGRRPRPGRGLQTRGCRIRRASGGLGLAPRTTTRARRPARTELLASRTMAAGRRRRARPRSRSLAATRRQGWCTRWRRLVAAFQRGRWRRLVRARHIHPRSATRGRPRLEGGAEKMIFVEWA